MRDPSLSDGTAALIAGDVKLSHQFGQVALDEPAWVKAGAAPAASSSSAPSAGAVAPPTR